MQRLSLARIVAHLEHQQTSLLDRVHCRHFMRLWGHNTNTAKQTSIIVNICVRPLPGTKNLAGMCGA